LELLEGLRRAGGIATDTLVEPGAILLRYRFLAKPDG
jgi:hypothetical protein